MNAKLLALLAVLYISASCAKIERAIHTEKGEIAELLKNDTDNDTPTVQVYFHMKRIVKLHTKIHYDDCGNYHTSEVVDEINDLLYIRCIGSSCGYRALYDMEIYCENVSPLLLWNAETRIVEGLNKEIMWIDHPIYDYHDPIPTINVTRFFAQKIAKTKTQSVIYNPLLNSWELCKLSI